MNDSAIRNFCTWARRELIEQVSGRLAYWGIAEDPSAPGGVADLAEGAVLGGRVLTDAERAQRAGLIDMARADGLEALAERGAYTWFNRLAAVRYMEVNGLLPCRTRMLSADDGSFSPQCLKEALDIGISGLDASRVLGLVRDGDDEALFRHLFLAQCDELAGAMPAVFERVGGAMELLLPGHLLRPGSVVERLVTDIPESDWREGVEIVGWMYQHYVSERKDEVFAGFKRGEKAGRGSIAPATQLFTPNWIVRYLVENSLGRLWMLNNPGSALRGKMDYYVDPALGLPEGQEPPAESFRRVSSPEEIRVVDPACGSGHILVYAFGLLSEMYLEAGYAARDAARLILERNLCGLEIDPRAAAMASFALTMRACELDPRFLRRGVSPRVTVLGRVELSGEELASCPAVSARPALLEAAAHLDECGSLLRPEPEDMAAIESDLAALAGDRAAPAGPGTVFAGGAAAKLEKLREELTPLAQRYDVVVANPPYMGSSNMDRWLAGWTKESYPDSKRDLCTCFIERGIELVDKAGYSAMVSMESWLFISSFETLRKRILKEHGIITLAQVVDGRKHADNFSANAMFVLSRECTDRPGCYFKLDFMGDNEKSARLLKALADPGCGWFYRRGAEAFETIPGSPIAYWASDAVNRAFINGIRFRDYARPRVGMQTGDNERFLRLWWEVGASRLSFTSENQSAFDKSKARWVAYNKGGQFRKWYGNLDYVLNWENEGISIRTNEPNEKRSFSMLPERLRFIPCITWTDITSSCSHFRFRPKGSLYDIKGMSCFPPENKRLFVLGACNSIVSTRILKMLSPTMNTQVGDVGKLPILEPDSSAQEQINALVAQLINSSKLDWDSFELSWDYVRSPLR